jgi:hypothetical protein
MARRRPQLLAIVRRATGAIEHVLDTPDRIRAAARALDTAATQLLDPPPFVAERIPTVPDGLQRRLAADDAQRERTAMMLASLTESIANTRADLERARQALFEDFPNLN